MIRVLVTDDEPLIRAGIRMILSSADDMEVVAEAANGREAVDIARSQRVDVALLDIQMPVMDGLTALAELRRSAPEVRVLILTTFGERQNVLRALGAGSAGFLLKDSAPAELMRAVRAAAAGEAYLSPGATRHVVDSLASGGTADRAERARRRLEKLTVRERDVLTLLGEGLSNADAGQRIHMSEATVKTYVSRILAKLECDNRVQAALLARDAGLGT
ncbi:DNA-binding response regulator [Streptomyces sp. FT05W]|uniref:Two component transcriptional regulator, LuxR family n=2 Tax=Streptomyces TaxID=1883 RepID=A0A8D3WFZ7_STRFA|nr:MULTISPECIES: response regulator transcription factor [Streptomyces]MBD2833239.1 response regulator transcription factor [Streptomyces pratensis]MYT51535.1 response regulator [Streptomyces sp. SID7815]MYT55468.1 response regulator [Streptomyces sp. SID7834]RAS30099.1 LuxR family two component transcriptional regulator [Streptomyces avidinii]TPM98755.1 response regulator transcription factor [Mesorhizobium sp. B2-3-3]SNX77822.1 two component transcriptional regulator, LuxR family [Streptomy